MAAFFHLLLRRTRKNKQIIIQLGGQSVFSPFPAISMLIQKINNLNVNAFFCLFTNSLKCERVREHEKIRDGMRWDCKLKRKLWVSPTFIGCLLQCKQFPFHNFTRISAQVQTSRKPNSNRKLCVRCFSYLKWFIVISVLWWFHQHFRLHCDGTMAECVFLCLFFTFGVSTWVFGAVKWSSIIFKKKKKETNENAFLALHKWLLKKQRRRERKKRATLKLNFTKSFNCSFFLQRNKIW